MTQKQVAEKLGVNRRTGGLENLLNIQVMIIDVNRRIGGLEKRNRLYMPLLSVNRRIGGLESIYSGQWGCIVLMKNNIGCVIIKLYSL